jgi:hypothetical protein
VAPRRRRCRIGASSPLGNSHRRVFDYRRRLCGRLWLANDERRGSCASGGIVLAGRRAGACDHVNDLHDLHGGLLILLDEIDGNRRPSCRLVCGIVRLPFGARRLDGRLRDANGALR